MRKTAIRKTDEKMDWRMEILMGPEKPLGLIREIYYE
jgi:hypothetical protein